MNKEYLKLLFFRTIGNFLIIMSLLMIAKTFLPALYQEGLYAFRQLRQVKTKVVSAPKSSAVAAAKNKPAGNPFLSLLAKLQSDQEIIIPKDTNFSIVIPKIAANSNIISNVDSSSYEEYIKALQNGVAHARGTAFPGDNGHIYLFAHSTDTIFNVGTYNAVFYLLYKLETNDEVYIFYQGKKYLYRVLNKKIVNPEEVQYLTRQSNKEFLTLQTCWPPGTTLKRLLIFAVPVAK